MAADSYNTAILRQAIADRDDEVNRLAEMDEDQLRYLSEVESLPDPETDGLECDHETRE